MQWGENGTYHRHATTQPVLSPVSVPQIRVTAPLSDGPSRTWSGNCTRSPTVRLLTKEGSKKMNTKLLVSLGSTLAATKLAQTVSRLEADDVLRVVGLARRRSTLLENIALFGMGALAGHRAAHGPS
jgi:hypothetical protein